MNADETVARLDKHAIKMRIKRLRLERTVAMVCSDPARIERAEQKIAELEAKLASN